MILILAETSKQDAKSLSWAILMHLKKRWSSLAKKIVGFLSKNINSEIKPPLQSKMRLQNIFESVIGYDLCQRGGLISSPRQGPLSLKYSIFCLVTQNMPHRTTKVFKLYFKFMVWCSFFLSTYLFLMHC